MGRFAGALRADRVGAQERRARHRRPVRLHREQHQPRRALPQRRARDRPQVLLREADRGRVVPERDEGSPALGHGAQRLRRPFVRADRERAESGGGRRRRRDHGAAGLGERVRDRVGAPPLVLAGPVDQEHVLVDRDADEHRHDEQVVGAPLDAEQPARERHPRERLHRTADKPHPRGAGNNPRVLGRYVRERGVIPLELAIHKMTVLPATVFGLGGRGSVAVGNAADLVVFDPETVADAATYDEPTAAPRGIPFVFVNGTLVVDGGAQTEARPGRILRRVP
ncbi:MAG: amidohydrolase family protein [Planctomycetes bacterium]|nr:amidohydrolase family protein [Planctomycetota bacterium]